MLLLLEVYPPPLPGMVAAPQTPALPGLAAGAISEPASFPELFHSLTRQSPTASPTSLLIASLAFVKTILFLFLESSHHGRSIRTILNNVCMCLLCTRAVFLEYNMIILETLQILCTN